MYFLVAFPSPESLSPSESLLPSLTLSVVNPFSSSAGVGASGPLLRLGKQKSAATKIRARTAMTMTMTMPAMTGVDNVVDEVMLVSLEGEGEDPVVPALVVVAPDELRYCLFQARSTSFRARRKRNGRTSIDISAFCGRSSCSASGCG